MRALASHHCGLGSIPGLCVTRGLILLLVLVHASRVFLRVLRFSSLYKSQHFNFQFDLEVVVKKSLLMGILILKFPFRIYLLLNLLAISSRYRRRPPPFDVGNLLLSRFFSPILDHNIFPKKVLFFFNIFN